MTLRCASCGRRLREYALVVQAATGPRGYGPKCARAVAPMAAARAAIAHGMRPRQVRHSRMQTADPRQIELELTA